MRSLSGPKAPDQPADPIVVHPDVRRMLLTQRAIAEGGRALVYYASLLADTESLHPDEAARGQSGELLDLLTPIVKGFLTEAGYESVNEAVQIYGGHGFIRENGVEQLVRDGRITLIYEGTTGIQGLDLLARKILMTQGKGLIQLVGEMKQTAEAVRAALPELSEGLDSVADEWAAMSMQLGGKAVENPDEIGAAAVDYLFYSGYAVLAFMWARIALAAHEGLEGADAGRTAYLQSKIDTARFYFARMLPRTVAHKQSLEAGGDCLMNICDGALLATM